MRFCCHSLIFRDATISLLTDINYEEKDHVLILSRPAFPVNDKLKSFIHKIALLNILSRVISKVDIKIIFVRSINNLSIVGIKSITPITKTLEKGKTRRLKILITDLGKLFMYVNINLFLFQYYHFLKVGALKLGSPPRPMVVRNRIKSSLVVACST